MTRRPMLHLAIILALGATAVAEDAAAPAPHRTRVLQAWDDTIKVNGQDVARHVEIVFDYTAGKATQRATDASGRVLEEVPLAAAPQGSREELAEAVATIQRDLELAAIVANTKAVFEGGFVLEEDPACGPGTRCMEVQILDQSRYGIIRRVIVDLMAERIAVRAYHPLSVISQQGGTR